MNTRRIINQCTAMTCKELEAFAAKNYKIVYNHITKTYAGGKAHTLLIGSIYTCIAVDGKFSDSENNFIRSFIEESTYDQNFETVSEFYNDEAKRIVKELAKLFPEDVKEAYISLCIAVLSVDKRVDDYEKSFLKDII